VLGGAMMVLATIRFRKIALDIDAKEVRPGTGAWLDLIGKPQRHPNRAHSASGLQAPRCRNEAGAQRQGYVPLAGALDGRLGQGPVDDVGCAWLPPICHRSKRTGSNRSTASA
jgi:hypothetical protein